MVSRGYSAKKHVCISSCTPRCLRKKTKQRSKRKTQAQAIKHTRGYGQKIKKQKQNVSALLHTPYPQIRFQHDNQSRSLIQPPGPRQSRGYWTKGKEKKRKEKNTNSLFVPNASNSSKKICKKKPSKAKTAWQVLGINRDKTIEQESEISYAVIMKRRLEKLTPSNHLAVSHSIAIHDS